MYMCVYMCVSACLCVSACVCVTHTSAHVLSAHHPLACTGQDNFIVVQTHEGFTIRALDARPALNVNLRSVEQVLPVVESVLALDARACLRRELLIYEY